MATETERKFLVRADKLETLPHGQAIRQGYIPTKDKTVVRARVKGDRAFLTIKGPVVRGSCSEFEYEIPQADAESIIEELCAGATVDKTRYAIDFAGHVWELDVFHGDNDGLLIAEVELDSIDEAVVLPEWVGEEVTGDTRYYNASLLRDPFCNWREA